MRLFSALLKSLYHVKIYHYYRHYFEVESYYAAHADNLWPVRTSSLSLQNTWEDKCLLSGSVYYY